MNFAPNITDEELAGLPSGGFEGQCVIVDTPEQINEACNYLLQYPVIGFDTETRPSFSKGVSYSVSLLQLSGPDRCYLFRLNKVRLDKAIIKVLESPKVVKVGAAIHDDIKTLRKLRRFRPEGFIDLQTIVGNFGIEAKSVRKMTAIALGIRISKAQRLSNWEAATLTPAQQLYAATDAWACREIYLKLHEK